MDDDRLDLTALRVTLASLADGLEVVNDRAWFSAQSSKVRNTLIAGVIQNFEFVYDVSVKMIRRRLEMDSLTPGRFDAANFRDVLRAAGEAGLISDVEAWFGYRALRNLTAHTYDHAKAAQVFAQTTAFVLHARHLLAALDARDA